MPELPQPRYSYRRDPTVPAFEEARALFVFDGECVLCSGGASWLMRRDRRARLNFTPARSGLGQALYRHYGVDANQTYLLLDRGRAYTESAGYLRLCDVLGGAWQLLLNARAVPERWRDTAYALVARNRYRWFGKAAHCQLLTPEQRARLL